MSRPGPDRPPVQRRNRELVIYVSADQKRRAQGVGDGAQEAAKAMGWDFRILDGRARSRASSALTQRSL